MFGRGYVPMVNDFVKAIAQSIVNETGVIGVIISIVCVILLTVIVFKDVAAIDTSVQDSNNE